MVTHEDWIAELHKLNSASDFTLEKGWLSATELCEMWNVSRTTGRNSIKKIVALGRADRETGYRLDCTGRQLPTPVYRLKENPDE